MFTLLGEYVHTMDPFAIQFTDEIGLRWYGLSYAAGFLAAWWIIRRLARTGRSLLSVEQVGDLVFYLIAGVLLGGRLGYAAFYDPALLVGFSGTLPFWDLLAINKGGMASHGGMIGVIVAIVIYAKRRDVSALHVLDLVAFAAPIGLGLGRVANFVNGELHGRAVPDQASPPWWSMKFPQELYEWAPAKLDRLADVVQRAFGTTSIEWTMLDDRARRGTVDRLILAVQDGNETVIEGLRPLLTAYYPSQLIQAATDGPLLLAVLALVWLKRRKPGIVGAWFLFAYGVMRIISERFREPDLGVALWNGLTRGQLLSVLLVVAGFISIVVCARRRVEPIGGLIRTA